MYRVLVTFLIIGLLGSACTSSTAKVKAKDNAKQRILALMQQQQEDWNSGNLEAYMSAYWKSDSLLFIGKRGFTYGWENTLSNYHKSYSNQEQMGALEFSNIKVDVLNKNAAWVAGNWQLNRKTDTLSGAYLLVWKRMNQKWVIVADHSS